jgi:hypothetical protein
MTLNQWDDNILIMELLDEPDFSEDTDTLILKLREGNEPFPNVMVICNISDPIWSTMLATGLDQVFEFIEDTTTALLLIGS